MEESTQNSIKNNILEIFEKSGLEKDRVSIFQK